jgi:hypothetical protein
MRRNIIRGNFKKNPSELNYHEKPNQNISEVQKLWQLLQNKEKQLKTKLRKTKAESEHLNNLQTFLTSHQLNPQTGYIESKWSKKSEAVACGAEVI